MLWNTNMAQSTERLSVSLQQNVGETLTCYTPLFPAGRTGRIHTGGGRGKSRPVMAIEFYIHTVKFQCSLSWAISSTSRGGIPRRSSSVVSRDQTCCLHDFANAPSIQSGRQKKKRGVWDKPKTEPLRHLRLVFTNAYIYLYVDKSYLSIFSSLLTEMIS